MVDIDKSHATDFLIEDQSLRAPLELFRSATAANTHQSWGPWDKWLIQRGFIQTRGKVSKLWNTDNNNGY